MLNGKARIALHARLAIVLLGFQFGFSTQNARLVTLWMALAVLLFIDIYYKTKMKLCKCIGH